MAEDRGAILLDYIRSQLLVDPERALDAETPLISEGLVDSMGLVMLAAFVEAAATVAVAQARLTPAQVAQLPAASGAKVDFARDVQPLFNAACVKCHGKGKSKGGFSLETRTAFLQGGDSGSPVVARRSRFRSLMRSMTCFCWSAVTLGGDDKFTIGSPDERNGTP